MSINSVHQLNNEICAQEILVESQDGEQYLVNLDGEEYYENQVSNCEESTLMHDDNSEESYSLTKHSWTPTSVEKQQLRNQGQPWKQGVWSKEETVQLKQNILDYCDTFSIKDPCEIIFESGKEKRKNFYKTIADGINRPLFAVYRRVVRMYDSKNHIGKYSAEELKKLQELRKEYGNDWQKIGLIMGRSAASIKDRCRHLKEDCNAGPWVPEEEDLLFEAVFGFTQCLPGENSVAGIPWIQIAHRVGSRSERQCRKKWLSYSNVKRIGAVEWNDADELYLIRRLSKIDSDKDIAWAELTQKWPRSSVRSHQWLRAKWKRLKSTVTSSEDLSLKEICHQLLMTRNNNVIGRSVATDVNTENCHSNSTHPRSVLNVIGVAPGASISAPIGLHFSKGVGQSRQTSVVLNLPCVTNIPMYFCTPNSSEGCSTVSSGTEGHQTIRFLSGATQDVVSGGDSVAVVHLDLDGGEEPAVTTDVMFSGSSLCNSHGSPLGFVDKSDHESDHSHARK
ncbi:cyclin-D-binding Myb-like transcription factor 1 isoform X1 [Daphnia pulicaria]|uniref:cyclin-D-binding Myb-like transcription factor 1 isoform X1 n=1 Tax=Daphnia pulicaria TaxID=35523 RepID=UPI001EEB838A|nr:cyclin-D-binding Myb-like transcription factor 1 isoform X1 [Daphnia pulicaria]